jgi:hypothetical protein
MSRAGIKRLHGTLGNSGVARLVTSGIQRDGPLGGRRRPSLLGDDMRLTLDPDIEAQMRAIQAMQTALTPAALRPNLLQLPASVTQQPAAAPGPLQGPAPPQPQPLVPRGGGPAEPRAASPGDLVGAIMAVPAIDSAITNLQTQAVDRVRRDWRDLGTGGQATVITSLAVIGGGALAGVMSDAESRNFALGQLNGRVIPVPGVGGLGVELNTEGSNVMVGLHLDIGRYLPESLGFGAGSAEPIGAPPISRQVADNATEEDDSELEDEAGAPPLHIQRQPPQGAAPAPVAAPASWRPPFGAPAATTKEDARDALIWVCYVPLHNMSFQLERAELPEPEDFKLAMEEATSWAQALQGDGNISAGEAEQLNSFSPEVQRVHDRELANLKSKVQTPLNSIARQSPPDYAAEEAKLAEQMHFAFIDGGEDQLGQIRDALGKVKDYTDKVNDVLTWAQRAASLAGSATTLARLESAVGGVSAMGDALEKVKAVTNAARSLATLAGVGNQAVGPAQNSIRQFEAGIQLIDVGFTFFKGVPLLGQLWSSYYMPLTEACIRLLGVIAKYADAEGRQWGVLEFWNQQTRGQRPNGAPPMIPSYLLQYFPGGQAMMNYIFPIMQGEQPAPSSSVRNYFLEHRDLFNAGRGSYSQLESESTSDWYNPWSWGDERLSTDLTPWVVMNRTRVWAMLYGDLSPNI